MNILLLAPHPFYQDRGTPIAVDLLLRALSARGDCVDLLTYHEGEDRQYPGVTIHRIAAPFGIRNLRPGLSAKKIVCDLYLARSALALARRRRYDIVHAVEEAVFIAMFLRRRFGLAYVFDMDSSMPLQIADKHSSLKFLLPWMRRCEAAAVRGAAAVAAVCDSLADIARSCGAVRTVVLRDISLLDPSGSGPARNLKSELGIGGTCFLYLGNLESYQGIDLLMESFARLRRDDSAAALVIGGGNREDIEKYRRKAAELGAGPAVHFIGPQPLCQMGSLFRGADVLVSPRTQGGNTPMKIYSYLDSGRPVLATRLPTHTQALDDTVAMLASPDAAAFAAAMERLVSDSALRAQLAEAARARALARHSFGAFRAVVLRLYGDLQAELESQRR